MKKEEKNDLLMIVIIIGQVEKNHKNACKEENEVSQKNK